MGKAAWVALVAALAAAGPSGRARAQEPVTLRVADSFPASHYLVKNGIEAWMAEVTARTNGAVKFQYFPAQQLGKAADLLSLAQSGVAQISYVAPSYVTDKMPLSGVTELPGMFATSCEGSTAYWRTVRSGVIAEQDFARNHVHPIFAAVLSPFQAYTRATPVTDASKLNGLKIKSTGAAMDLTLRAVGAVPVRLSAPDSYQGVSRGTIDGVVFVPESILAYSMQKLVRHGTTGAGFGSFAITYVISDESWDKLSPEVRKTMQDVSDALVPKLCAAIDASVGASEQQLKQAGIELDPFSGAAEQSFRKQTEPVSTAWAAGLEEHGKPGRDALASFRSALGQ